jgi:zinc D-Ala-D-Ala carboxypeptidase
MAAPAWCDTPALRDHWERPWTVPLSKIRARKFKKRCWEHGYLSPHFTRAECGSKDGTAIPSNLRGNAQRQAFHLERYRHKRGDRPIGILSFYRSPSHNAAVGGASASQHVQARAVDFVELQPYTPVEQVWGNGGIGTYQGAVRHADCRRGAARWTYG